MKRILLTLSEPRVITAAMVLAYTLVLIFGAILIPQLAAISVPWWMWGPALLMILGAAMSLPAAWVGCLVAIDVERVGIIFAAGGLLGGVLIESADLIRHDLAGELLIFLMCLILIGVCLRYWQLSHRARHLLREGRP